MTINNRNVQKLIEETRAEFKADLDKVNRRLDKSDKDNVELIQRAIAENNLRLESRLDKLEEKGEKEKEGLSKQEQVELITKLVNKKITNKPDENPVAEVESHPVESPQVPQPQAPTNHSVARYGSKYLAHAIVASQSPLYWHQTKEGYCY